jgi:hypothetical protein
MVVRKTRADRLLSDDLVDKLSSEGSESAGDLYTPVKRDSSNLFDLVEDALVQEESSVKGVKVVRKKGSLGGVLYALLIIVFAIALLGLGYIAYSFITTSS